MGPSQDAKSDTEDNPEQNYPTAFRWERELQRLSAYVNWIGTIAERLERQITLLEQHAPRVSRESVGQPPGESPAGRSQEGQALPEPTKEEVDWYEKAMERAKLKREDRLKEAQARIDEWGEDGPTDDQLEEYRSTWMTVRR